MNEQVHEWSYNTYKIMTQLKMVNIVNEPMRRHAFCTSPTKKNLPKHVNEILQERTRVLSDLLTWMVFRNRLRSRAYDYTSILSGTSFHSKPFALYGYPPLYRNQRSHMRRASTLVSCLLLSFHFFVAS